MQLQKAVMDGLYLYNQSEEYRLRTLAEFNTYCVYPILHSRIKIYYQNEKPVGLVTWIWLTNEEAALFEDGEWEPTEEAWKRTESDQFWGVDFIAPFGSGQTLVKYMMKDTFRHATSHVDKKYKTHWLRPARREQRYTRDLNNG